MKVKRLEAVRFSNFMNGGRTKPALCGCRNPDTRLVEDYVVKLKGNIESGTFGLVAELVASLLASKFGVMCPAPALVNISKDFVEAVSNADKNAGILLGKSLGLNFGCELLQDVSLTVKNSRLPESLLSSASNLFAFDCLIQNIDRRTIKQNSFQKTKEIMAFDHEMAFSFVFDIIAPSEPWDMKKESFPKDHLYYNDLKGAQTNFNQFKQCLKELSDENIREVMSNIPTEWYDIKSNKIESHLILIRNNADKFINSIEEILK